MVLAVGRRPQLLSTWASSQSGWVSSQPGSWLPQGSPKSKEGAAALLGPWLLVCRLAKGPTLSSEGSPQDTASEPLGGECKDVGPQASPHLTEQRSENGREQGE